MIQHVTVHQDGKVIHANKIVPPVKANQIHRALSQHHTIRTFNAYKGVVIAIVEPEESNV
ncbi:MAG: hypothetical protein ACYS7Y_11785 [Planctomycetota bacterium]|jgi:hypothetical protein